MGIVGLGVLALVVFGLIRYTPIATRTLLGTDGEDVALGIASLIMASAVFILIGSPISSVPHGIIWWFFFGAILKLAMIRHEASLTTSPADFASAGET